MAALITLAGCGGATIATKTVTKTVVASAARHVIPRAHRRAPTPAAASPSPAPAPSGYRSCDRNVSARSGTTTCPFAQNVFYEYWKSGGAATVEAFSSATNATLRLTCTTSRATVTCDTDHGGSVRFPQAAVDAYSSRQAATYRAGHDVGPSSQSAPAPSPPTAPTPTGSGPTPANEIPNYDNGTGSVVQCTDGMYSHSGGRPGACSGHGGER